MSWKTNKNGEKVYNLSLYAKEELPTWGEIHELYSKKKFFYDPKDQNDQALDTYWKIPHQKYLLGIFYNQLNKMIFEDKFDYSAAFTNMDYKGEKCNITDIRFVYIEPPEVGTPISELKGWAEMFLCGTSSQPPIITIPLPNGDSNIFITNNHPRININELNNITIIPVIGFDTDNNKNMITVFYPEDDESSMYWNILRVFMKPYEDYFEEPVGWKDINTKPTRIIGADINTHCK